VVQPHDAPIRADPNVVSLTIEHTGEGAVNLARTAARPTWTPLGLWKWAQRISCKVGWGVRRRVCLSVLLLALLS
jgi:hypothetical protein